MNLLINNKHYLLGKLDNINPDDGSIIMEDNNNIRKYDINKLKPIYHLPGNNYTTDYNKDPIKTRQYSSFLLYSIPESYKDNWLVYAQEVSPIVNVKPINTNTTLPITGYIIGQQNHIAKFNFNIVIENTPSSETIG